MDSQVERAEATFESTEPTDIDQTLGNCFRSQNPLKGFFQAGTWTFDFPVVAVTSGGDQDGRIRIRVFKSSFPDVISAIAVLLSGGSSLLGSGVTNLAVGTPQTSTITWIPGQALFFDNEYLYVLVMWERTGAGAAADRDVLLRVGSTAKITTPDFVISGLSRLTANVNRAIDPDDSDVLDVQQNVFPQELFAAKCTPRGFLVIPKVVRVGPRSLLWTKSGTWPVFTSTGMIEDKDGINSSTTNDFIEITIRARAFRFMFHGVTDRGIANVTIDGVAPSTITGVTMEDGSVAQNTIDMYRAAATDRVFVGYKGLSNAAHTVRITVSGTKNAASTGFIITSQGIEYVDTLCDAADGVACNQVFVLPVGDREGLVDPGDTALTTYVGAWTTVNDVFNLLGRHRESSTAGDYFEITFTGTGIVLLFVCDGSRGFLDITVDGILVAKRWTGYQPTTLHYNYPLPILGLADASHTVRVTVNAANENNGTKIVTHGGHFIVKGADVDGYGGVLLTAERRWNKTGLDSMTMLATDAANPRKDLLIVNKSGVFSIIQGTAGATPAEPEEPTDDRMPLAVLRQEKAGILPQKLHPQNPTTENEDAEERYVQDRRRGIVTSMQELPLGIQILAGAANAVSAPFRLPLRAKRVRVRRTGGVGTGTGRQAIRVFGSSPTIQREFDDTAAIKEGFINVDGLGGKTVQLFIVSAQATTPADFQAISVM